MRDRALGSTVRIQFTTHTFSTGVVVAPSSAFVAADFKIYKDGSSSEKTSTNGITVTSPWDSLVGTHLIEIDTSNSTGDPGFWTSGSAYRVVIVTAKTVDSKDPSNVCVGEFSLELQTADVRKIGGDAQSAIDLKDFADAGYDPSTNKVQGVVLVDTTTTNSDMRGTDNAALAATALSTSVWTNTLATNIGTTNTTVAANLDATISSRLASASYTAPPSAATISTQVASDLAIAHGAGLWETATGFAVPGSEMTLTSAYDAAKTAATQTSVDDLPTNAELAVALGTADDAVLAAIAAEAVKTAAIKVTTDRINTGLVADGQVWQFTANMLELAPAGGGGGGGGDATLANQEAILAAIQGTEVIQVASPNVLGNLVLTQGDSYDGIANPKAQWTVTTDYTSGWSVVLTIRDKDDAVVYTTSGTVVNSTTIAVTLAAPTGLPMTGCPGQWQGKFDVQLTKDGSKKTIALGVVYINEDQTR
jgi:hypothetical protein